MKAIIPKMICMAFLVLPVSSQNERKVGETVDYASLLKAHFRPYFQIERKDESSFQISENDPVWKYVAESFSRSTPKGANCWFNNQPDGVSKSALGQCYLARPGFIEIRLHHKFNKGSLSVDDFWRTLIFELCNAEQAERFLDLMEKLSNGEITRTQFSDSTIKLEFSSALKAKEFQKNIWRPLCKKNNIDCSDIDWFFPDGATFQQWLDMLNTTEEGREYLGTYLQ